jgi:N-acetylglucosamine repressor
MNRGEILQLNRGGFQIGHVQLDEHGPQCNCGNFGCVEAFISEQAARRDLKLASAHDADYHVDIENLKYSDIVSRSNRGDPYAKEVLFNQCEYLGRAVAMAINLYAPNMVLIGGPLSQSRLDIIDIIEKSAAKNELEIFRNGNTEIKFTNTGEKACFIGMANKIVNSEFFKREI